jgi:hypothetical protein
LVLNRKGQLALAGILVVALLGGFASSMIPTGGLQIKNMLLQSSIYDCFTIAGTTMVANGVTVTMNQTNGINVALLNITSTVITNMVLTKHEDGKTLVITATKATGSNVLLKATNITSSSANFLNLTITDEPSFSQVMASQTMTNADISAFYQFAGSMTLQGFQMKVS